MIADDHDPNSGLVCFWPQCDGTVGKVQSVLGDWCLYLGKNDVYSDCRNLKAESLSASTSSGLGVPRRCLDCHKILLVNYVRLQWCLDALREWMLGHCLECHRISHFVLIVRPWLLLTIYVPMGGALQKIVQAALYDCTIYFNYYQTSAVHPRGRHLYDTMSHLFSWSHMAEDIHMSVEDCLECSQERSQMKSNRMSQRFSAPGPLESVAIFILGPLPKNCPRDNLWLSWPIDIQTSPAQFPP